MSMIYKLIYWCKNSIYDYWLIIGGKVWTVKYAGLPREKNQSRTTENPSQYRLELKSLSPAVIEYTIIVDRFL